MLAPPTVSVVVATRDRAALLERLLASLRAQTVDDFEVVVVDDGSTDATAQVLARAADAMRITVLRNERSLGPSAARDAGWVAATAPLVAFTDDDCEAAPDWLAAGLAAWDGAPGRFVQGRTDPDPAGEPSIGPFSRTLRVHSLGPHFQTCNIFYPRELLERVGGFDETLQPGAGEDSDLAWRCLDAGAEPVFAPEAQVFHAVHDLGPLGKLRIATLYSKTVAILRRHPGRRPLTYGVFWHKSHYLLVRALIGLLLPRRRVLLPLRFWCVAPLAPSYLERVRDERGPWWLAPYFLLYDVVELVSVVRGAIRNRIPVL